jgi:hypothetical protein
MKGLSYGVLVTLVAICLAANAGLVQAEAALEVGDKAPEFPHPVASTAGEKPAEVKLQLSDFVGKKNIVLAFYVADWTGG